MLDPPQEKEPRNPAAFGGGPPAAPSKWGADAENFSPVGTAKGRGPPPPIPDHQLVRCIGAGSYGEVWLARSVLGTWRAVKIVYRSTFANQRPFDREFRGIQKFEPISRSHPSQVNILHVGRQADDSFYYVMELADPAPASPCEPEPFSRGTGKSPDVPALPDWEPSVDPDNYRPKTLKLEREWRGRLPVGECLEIGLGLTTALSHLHKHGLVHRDVKPSNIIFVKGVPKLADIGLVTDVDATVSFVGTEGFIPPEGPGTPQADIYGLGKVLYEISTGKDRQDFPEPPTLLGDFVDREALLELGEIIKKACARDPAKRYQNAEVMQTDLLLLKMGKSVRQTRKLERRLAIAIKTGVFIATIAVLAMTAYLVARNEAGRARQRSEAEVKLRQQAEAARQTAEVESTKSRQVAQFLQDMLQGVGPSVALGHDTTMLKEILDKTAQRVGKGLAGEPDVEAALRATIGRVYDELGAYTNAETMFRQALALRERSPGLKEADTATMLDSLGYVLYEQNRLNEAEALLTQTLALRRQLPGSTNAETAGSLHHLAALRQRQGRYSEAEVLYREAAQMRARTLGKEHPDVAASLDGLANALRREQKLGEAETTEREALAIERKTLGNDHPAVAHSLFNLAQVLRDHDRPVEAEKFYREALALYERLLGKEHPDVASCMDNLGRALTAQGKLAEAELMDREALTIQKRLLGSEHPDVAWSLNSLASVLKIQGRLTEAEGLFREILRIRLAALPSEHVDVGYAILDLVDVLRAEGKPGEATSACRDAANRGSPVAQGELGSMYQRGESVPKDLAEAARWYRKAAEHSEKLADGGDIRALNTCAWLLATCDNPLVRDGHDAVRFAQTAATMSRRKNPTVLDTLAAAYAEAGDFDKATSTLGEAMTLIKDDSVKQRLTSQLKLYASKIPYHEK